MTHVDEVEVKYRLTGAAEHDRLRAALSAAGARHTGRVREQNRLYRDAAGALVQAGAVLRVRILDGGPAGTVTFKGRARYDGAVKTRAEIETGVTDAARMHALLEALGFAHSHGYDKERETWETDGVEVALDTLAFGHFCEIEGPADAIRRVAARLGLDDTQAEPRGYPSLAAAAMGNRQSGARGMVNPLPIAQSDAGGL